MNLLSIARLTARALRDRALRGTSSSTGTVTRAPAVTRETLEDLRVRLERLEAQMAKLAGAVDGVREIARATLDDVPRLRERLLQARASRDYETAFASPEPLVTVRIATFDRPDVLVERAVASVRAQTYRRWELVVVGDGDGRGAADALAKIGDPRIRFIATPHRGVYPEDPSRRWLVAGTPAANRAVELARGDWIAPLDDDDAFTPDHLEVLVRLAQEGQYEVAYGALRRVGEADPDRAHVYRYPPAHGWFGFQGALYLRALSFFAYDPDCWTLGEPGDWNLMRRMLAAGVLVGGVDRVVTDYYPSAKS